MWWWVIGGAVALWVLSSTALSVAEQAKVEEIRRAMARGGSTLIGVSKVPGGYRVIYKIDTGETQSVVFSTLDEVLQ